MSTADLRAFLDESKVNKASLAQLALEGRKQGAFDDYMTVVDELKQHPTTTVLQCQFQNVKAAIDRQWKTFERFRAEFGIPTPASGNPNVTQDVAAWGALQKTRATDRRRELLERICQFLRHDGPMSFADLRNLITAGEVTLREVLATAEADGVLERARFGKSLEYRLVRTVVVDYWVSHAVST